MSTTPLRAPAIVLAVLFLTAPALADCLCHKASPCPAGKICKKRKLPPPTINPGTAFGFSPTVWRAWPEPVCQPSAAFALPHAADVPIFTPPEPDSLPSPRPVDSTRPITAPR